VGSQSVVDDHELSLFRERYAGFAPPPLSYGTVRDYIDSLEWLPRLARYQGDLKDIQRSWMLKTIVGMVPQGGKLVEIGAGQPLVAHVLHRAGYDVTVVDPYDGSGNGPKELEKFRHAYPGIRFVIDRFQPRMDAIKDGSIDCCYSVSVIEHIPLAQIAGVFEEIKRVTAPGGHSIHAVDHVLLGRGDEYHLRVLSRVATASGLEASDVWTMLQKTKGDPETYFLSAEAHNKWRGTISYDSFPMRRCISVQFCTERKLMGS
jgi:ubiquinone/menaquinone biosynthesis C-methylase UbiE